MEKKHWLGIGREMYPSITHLCGVGAVTRYMKLCMRDNVPGLFWGEWLWDGTRAFFTIGNDGINGRGLLCNLAKVKDSLVTC